MRRAAVALGLALLAGCASSDAPAPPVTAPLPAPVGPPPPISVAPPPMSVPSAPQRDQCGAWELGWLVGRSRAEIPVPVDPNRRRVVCTTCPRTMDFLEGRLTIEYDAATNRVTGVACN